MGTQDTLTETLCVAHSDPVLSGSGPVRSAPMVLYKLQPSLFSKSTSMTSFLSYRVRHTAEFTLTILLALRISLLSCPLLCLYSRRSSLSRHLKSAETMLESAKETKSLLFKREKYTQR